MTFDGLGAQAEHSRNFARAAALSNESEDLEFAIQKANPWMNAELTSEQLDEEIERLTEVRDQVREREEGEAGSASK